MKSKKYKCLYCHSEFTIKRQIKEQKDGSFTYELREINFCPFCGMPYKHTIDTTKDFMNLFPVTNELNNSVKLLMKGEPDAAIRDASAVLENIIKKKSGIQDKHGKALIGEAFNTGKDIELEPPKIKINDLKTESEKNEQDGLRLMLLGYFGGIRNLYMHIAPGHGMKTALAIIYLVDFFISVLNGGTLTKKARWIKDPFDINNALEKMPNKDRLLFMLDNMGVKKTVKLYLNNKKNELWQ